MAQQEQGLSHMAHCPEGHSEGKTGREEYLPPYCLPPPPAHVPARLPRGGYEACHSWGDPRGGGRWLTSSVAILEGLERVQLGMILQSHAH